jgi:hypothetical protein
VTLPKSNKSAAFIQPSELKEIGKTLLREIKKYKKFNIFTSNNSVLEVTASSEHLFDFEYLKTKTANFPSGEIYFSGKIFAKGEFVFECTPRKIEWKLRKKKLNNYIEEIGIGIKSLNKLIYRQRGRGESCFGSLTNEFGDRLKTSRIDTSITRIGARVIAYLTKVYIRIRVLMGIVTHALHADKYLD